MLSVGRTSSDNQFINFLFYPITYVMYKKRRIFIWIRWENCVLILYLPQVNTEKTRTFNGTFSCEIMPAYCAQCRHTCPLLVKVKNILHTKHCSQKMLFCSHCTFLQNIKWRTKKSSIKYESVHKNRATCPVLGFTFFNKKSAWNTGTRKKQLSFKNVIDYYTVWFSSGALLWKETRRLHTVSLNQ